MGKTSIEWTDRSINPIRARIGENVGHHCVKISPGCKNCYSSRTQPRFRMPVFQEQRGQDVETYLDGNRLAEVMRRRTPTKWFWCDMTDLFGDWVPFEMIAACFGVMAATPQHTHQVLTKRPERAREFFEWWDGDLMKAAGAADEVLPGALAAKLYDHFDDEMGESSLPYILPNVWLGVSAENQEQADKRIPVLLELPAAVHFVSAEPLLGPIDFTHIQWPGKHRVDVLRGGYWTGEGQPGAVAPGFVNHSDFPAELDWIICGGESGNGARPCNVEWIRDIVRQCEDTRCAVFVKQLGRTVVENRGRDEERIGGGADRPNVFAGRITEDGTVERQWHPINRKGGDMAEFPEPLRVRQFPEVRHG
jgi:protein gp37